MDGDENSHDMGGESNEIERLKLALLKDNDFEEEFDSEDDEEGSVRNEGNWNNSFQVINNPQEREGFIEEDEDDETDDDEEGGMGLDDEDLPPNSKTCLALNLAYQEIITENLRQIEISMEKNKEKQAEVQQALEEQANDKLLRTHASYATKCSVQRPFIRDSNGMVPPPNDDMKERTRLQMFSMTEKPSFRYWQECDDKELYPAVKQAVQQCLMRPVMNRQALEYDRLAHALPRAQHAKRNTLIHNLDERIKKHIARLEELKMRKALVDIEEMDELEENIATLQAEIADEEDLLRTEEEKAKLKLHITEDIQAKIDDYDKQLAAIRRMTPDELFETYDQEKIDGIDWMRISATEMKGLFSAESCRLRWMNYLHPAISKTEFTKEDDEKILELANKYGGKDWPRIAQELGGKWSPFILLRRYQQSLNPCLETGKWVRDEDEFLREVVINLKDSGGYVDWGAVGNYFEGRSSEQCRNRYNLVFGKHKTGRWEPQDDRKLVEAVRKLGRGNWIVIADYVGNRSARQCRCRWNNHLRPEIKHGDWSYEEDKILWLAAQKQLQTMGTLNWHQICKQLPGRTGNTVMQRHRRMREWEKLEPFMKGLGEEVVQKYIDTGRQDDPPVDMSLILARREFLKKKVERHDHSLKRVSSARQRVIPTDRQSTAALLEQGIRIISREEAAKNQPRSQAAIIQQQEQEAARKELQEKMEKNERELKEAAEKRLKELLEKRKQSLMLSLKNTRTIQQLDDDDISYMQRLNDIKLGIFIPRAPVSRNRGNNTRTFMRKARFRKHLHDVIRSNLDSDVVNDSDSIQVLQDRINRMGSKASVRDLLDLKRMLNARAQAKAQGEEVKSTEDEEEEEEEEEPEEIDSGQEDDDKDYEPRPKKLKNDALAKLPVHEQEKHKLLDKQLVNCFPIVYTSTLKGRPSVNFTELNTVQQATVRTPLPEVFRRRFDSQLSDETVSKVALLILKMFNFDTEEGKKRAQSLMQEQREKRAVIEEAAQQREFEEQVHAVTSKGRRVKYVTQDRPMRRTYNPRLAGISHKERKGVVPLRGEEEINMLEAVLGSIEPEVASLSQVTLPGDPSGDQQATEGTEKKKAVARRRFRGDKASIYNIAPLPPNRCTLTGFKRLLLVRNSLCTKAGFVLSLRPCKRKTEILGTRDLLGPVRQTHDYELLRRRFQSLFLWPAILSDTPIPRQDVTALTRIQIPRQPMVTVPHRRRKPYAGSSGARRHYHWRWMKEEKEAQEILFRRIKMRADQRKECMLALMAQGVEEEEASRKSYEKFPKLQLTRRDVLLEILERKGIDPEDHAAAQPKVVDENAPKRGRGRPGGAAFKREYYCLKSPPPSTSTSTPPPAPAPAPDDPDAPPPKKPRGRPVGARNGSQKRMNLPLRLPRAQRKARLKMPEDFATKVTDIGCKEDSPRPRRVRKEPEQRVTASRHNKQLLARLCHKYDSMNNSRNLIPPDLALHDGMEDVVEWGMRGGKVGVGGTCVGAVPGTSSSGSGTSGSGVVGTSGSGVVGNGASTSNVVPGTSGIALGSGSGTSSSGVVSTSAFTTVGTSCIVPSTSGISTGVDAGGTGVVLGAGSSDSGVGSEGIGTEVGGVTVPAIPGLYMVVNGQVLPVMPAVNGTGGVGVGAGGVLPIIQGAGQGIGAGGAGVGVVPVVQAANSNEEEAKQSVPFVPVVPGANGTEEEAGDTGEGVKQAVPFVPVVEEAKEEETEGRQDLQAVQGTGDGETDKVSPFVPVVEEAKEEETEGRQDLPAIQATGDGETDKVAPSDTPAVTTSIPTDSTTAASTDDPTSQETPTSDPGNS